MLKPAVAILALVLPSSAFAQVAPELGYGFAATSNYIFRGESQSGGRPALQAYGEVDLAPFYFGAWASTVRIGDDRAELNLYAGARRSFGNLTADIAYTRYLYDDSGDCCGELGLALDYAVDEIIAVGGAFFYDFDLATRWAEASSAVGLGERLALGGALGTDFGSLDLGRGDKRAWHLGLTYGLADFAGVDLRYHDSNVDPARAVLSVSLDF
ncbi:TorF family putative porin [soil metagenome]